MAVATTYWYDRVATQCPGLDEALFVIALHKVMRDYFTQSRAWWDELTISATAGVDTIDVDTQYQVPSETYKRTAQIWVVQIDGRPIRPLTRPWFSLRYRENLGLYWWADQPPILKFSEPFSADTDVDVSVSVKPLDGIVEVPDFVADHHDDAIESGLLAYFLAMPAKPWTNLNIAAYHETKYKEYIGEARAVSERAYTPADSQWTYPRSFA